jgi:hypothetical protein
MTNASDSPPDIKDVLTPELLMHGYWHVASLSAGIFWPTKAQKLRWHGTDFWIIPVTKQACPAIATRGTHGNREEQKLLMRFISMLSWVEGTGYALEGGGLSGGNLPRPMGRPEGRMILTRGSALHLPYFPEVSDERAMRALGLMREGRSLNHAGYAFLSYFKILETAFPEPPKRVEWMTATISNLDGFGVKEALGHIRAEGAVTAEAISKHLFVSGRCAVAHAATTPVIDPDDPSDLRRLGSELPIMQALAVRAIEEAFGVETRGTNTRKHLYELAGFKAIIGPDIVANVRSGPPLRGSPMLDIPDISVGIRGRDPYAPLERLKCKHAAHEGKMMRLTFASAQDDVEFRFALDFNAERLHFDVYEDLIVRDNGTAAAADRVHDTKRFFHDYFLNGQLQILNADTGELISRKDAFMPVNMIFDPKGAAAELDRWKELAARRREVDQGLR